MVGARLPCTRLSKATKPENVTFLGSKLTPSEAPSGHLLTGRMGQQQPVGVVSNIIWHSSPISSINNPQEWHLLLVPHCVEVLYQDLV